MEAEYKINIELKTSLPRILSDNFPGLEWSYPNENGNLVVYSTEHPVINDELLKIWDEQLFQKELKNLYKLKRKEAYEKISIEDQLDMLWHSMDSGEIPRSEDFFQAILSVKNKYQKGA